MNNKLYVPFFMILLSLPCLAQDEVVMNASDYNRSIEYYNQALDYLSDYKDDLAIEFMSKAIEMNDGNADFYLGRAQTYSLLNKLELAEKDILVAVELTKEQFDIHYTAGNIFFKASKMTKAIDHYTLALEYSENDGQSLSNCLFNRGNSYLELKQYKQAEIDFSESISLNPEFIGALHNRGIARKNLDLKNDACMDFIKADSLGSNKSYSYLLSFCD